MSQKNYDLMIVEALLRKENHIRGLAKDLGTNQTTVSRKVFKLYAANVVDFRFQGKNKVLFLKKTLEAKQYAYMVELFKLLAAVKKYPRLRLIVEKIRSNSKIRLAILFGSYAKGNANKESDIDIYIDSIDRGIQTEVSRIGTKLSVKIGSYDAQSLLIREIEKNHVIIKGVEEYYEKSKFFG